MEVNNMGVVFKIAIVKVTCILSMMGQGIAHFVIFIRFLGHHLSRQHFKGGIPFAIHQNFHQMLEFSFIICDRICESLTQSRKPKFTM